MVLKGEFEDGLGFEFMVFQEAHGFGGILAVGYAVGGGCGGV
uniref:Uncharacterized protein n=1 Tax=Fagus sylvatica TaxID=28930 RepID=A0A2N9GAE1_FAGSY